MRRFYQTDKDIPSSAATNFPKPGCKCAFSSTLAWHTTPSLFITNAIRFDTPFIPIANSGCNHRKRQKLFHFCWLCFTIEINTSAPLLQSACWLLLNIVKIACLLHQKLNVLWLSICHPVFWNTLICVVCLSGMTVLSGICWPSLITAVWTITFLLFKIW